MEIRVDTVDVEVLVQLRCEPAHAWLSSSPRSESSKLTRRISLSDGAVYRPWIGWRRWLIGEQLIRGRGLGNSGVVPVAASTKGECSVQRFQRGERRRQHGMEGKGTYVTAATTRSSYRVCAKGLKYEWGLSCRKLSAAL